MGNESFSIVILRTVSTLDPFSLRRNFCKINPHRIEIGLWTMDFRRLIDTFMNQHFDSLVRKNRGITIMP